MSTDNRIRNRSNFRMPLLILGFTMTAIFIGLGSWILLDKSFLTGIPSEYRNIFAIMVLLYGTYRGWRVYAEYF